MRDKTFKQMANYSYLLGYAQGLREEKLTVKDLPFPDVSTQEEVDRSLAFHQHEEGDERR